MDKKRLYDKVAREARVIANRKLRDFYDPDKSSDLARPWAPFTARWREEDGDVIFQLELRTDPRSRALKNEPWPQDIATDAIRAAMKNNIIQLMQVKMMI